MEAEDGSRHSIQMQVHELTRSSGLHAYGRGGFGTGLGRPPERDTDMAYILRSLAVIGVIALNSPVHGGRSDGEGAIETVRSAARAASRIDARSAIHGVTAAREAAEILAGLDPETRKRVLDLTLQAAAARSGANPRETTAGIR